MRCRRMMFPASIWMKSNKRAAPRVQALSFCPVHSHGSSLTSPRYKKSRF
jgi:hypothetical protein